MNYADENKKPAKDQTSFAGSMLTYSNQCDAPLMTLVVTTPCSKTARMT